MTEPRAQPDPKRISVDEIRRRCWGMLKEKKKSGAMPRVDTKAAAIAALLFAGFNVTEISQGLGVSANWVRVEKRKALIKIGVETPAKDETKKERKASAAERKRLSKIPDWSIDELHALLQQLPPLREVYADDREMLAALHRAGLDVS